jgi:ABC-2 type transport system permease protein
MKSLLKMTWMEGKLFLREPASAFFTLIFPLMLLLLFGAIFGNEPTPILGGRGTIDISLPMYTAMIIGTVGLMPTTITLSSYREKGILRRLRTTPINPLVILAAQVVVVFVMVAMGMLLLVAAGIIVFHVRFEGNIFSVLGGFALGCLSFFGIGFILAGILPNARTAQIVGLVILYPMIYLSGAAFPMEMMPETLKKISQFLPLTYVVNLLRGLWVGDAWSQHVTDVIVLAVILIAGVIISVRLFRWE